MKLMVIHKTTLIVFFLTLPLLLFTQKICQSLFMITTMSTDTQDDFIYKISQLTKGKEKIAYLTFDDGPTSSVTPKILDILAEEDVKATFFVIGKSVEEHPEIVKQAYDEGHYIANHTYSHNNSILYQSTESFIQELQKTDRAIAKAIDEDDYCSHLFRFPNGYMSPIYTYQKKKLTSVLASMDYAFIDWNCLTKDAEKKCSTYQLLSNLKQTAKNKNTLVVLMHDTKDVNDSSLVLKDAITYLRKEGYEFDNFYSLMN